MKQSIREINEALKRFYDDRDAEWASHNFQQVLDTFIKEIDADEMHLFLMEMQNIILHLPIQDSNVTSRVILSFVILLQHSELIDKVRNLPFIYFRAV